MQRRGIIAILLSVPIAALLLWMGMRVFRGDASSEQNTQTPESIVRKTPDPSPPPVPAPAVPAEFADFFDWTKKERVAKVTAYVENTELPADIKSFYVDCLDDRRLGRLVRNNMAEALVVQREPVEGLADRFLKIIADPEETKDFRLYSIQHLAMCLETASDPEGARRQLRRLATESADEDIATRALLMVDYAEGEGEIEMASLDGEIGKKLGDASLSNATRISLFALVGSRGLTEHLETVRAEARRRSPVQRAAIAALGNIGDEIDLPFLREQAGSTDYGVSMAARGALKRLERRSE